jgi:hypothetical protein
MNAQGELTVDEAATACGVNPKTIRRRLEETTSPLYDDKRPPDSLPNAWQQGRRWWIPKDDLLAAGWDVEPVIYEMLSAPPDDDEELVPDWRTRAHVAEALVDELRGRLHDKDAVIEAQQATIDTLRGEPS